MEVQSLPSHRTQALMAMMDRVLDKRGWTCPQQFHDVQACKDVAMLVDPVNSAPFIVTPMGVLFTFDHVPGSGTDALRQRVRAQLFFNSLVDGHRARAMQRPLAQQVDAYDHADADADADAGSLAGAVLPRQRVG